MKQRNEKHEKRLKKLVLTCLLLAVVLTVGTYAWFIGMQTVNVSTFEVNIATVEDLALSLDGTSWSTDLNVTKEALEGNAYAKGNHSWTDLIPVSTVGEISSTTSKLVMFDKGSLTATNGGYRLMSALVENKATTSTDAGEVDGYVAFDLFIKNMSGDAYYPTITDPSNEEAIYLATDSSVVVKESGTDVSGIQNSVRVAFAQIGRVKSDSDATLMQSITCTPDEDSGITSICANRDATIWEPNDKAHVANAISWFTKTCKTRDENGAYTSTACEAIANNNFYTTYAVSGVIDHDDGVDVYDGLNDYEGTIAQKRAEGTKLVGVDTFTDSEKILTGTARPEFFYLAPNSVTKVRVYVYLEGQDVDNYDFASLGNNIVVNFGFTKERFTQNEITNPGV